MPAFEKSSPALIAVFDAAVPIDPRVERRKMFGHECAWVGGNMFTGLFADGLWVRLDETGQHELLAAGGSPFAPMAGRVMRGYIVAPAAIVANPAALRGWMERGLEHTATLPPKQKKPPKRKTATGAG